MLAGAIARRKRSPKNFEIRIMIFLCNLENQFMESLKILIIFNNTNTKFNL